MTKTLDDEFEFPKKKSIFLDKKMIQDRPYTVEILFVDPDRPRPLFLGSFEFGEYWFDLPYDSLKDLIEVAKSKRFRDWYRKFNVQAVPYEKKGKKYLKIKVIK